MEKKQESNLVPKKQFSHIPESLEKTGLKLLRLDKSQAHFIDSKGEPWYFDIDKKLWREMNEMDLHPMGLQLRQEIPFEKSTFENPKDAMAYALMKHFASTKEDYEDMIEFLGKKYGEADEKKQALETLFEKLMPVFNEIIETLDRYVASSDEGEKQKCLTSYEALLEKLEALNT